MYFRFGIVLISVIALALAGLSIEKRNLSLRRSISLQEYRRAQLLEQRRRVQLRIERLSAPRRLLERDFSTAAEPDQSDRR